MTYYPVRQGMTAFLDGCDVPCPVHHRDGVLYANVGPLLRRLTTSGPAYRDSDGRSWTITERQPPPTVSATQRMVETFNRETDQINEAILEKVSKEFGAHPMGWPVPPRVLPKWFQPSRSKRYRYVQRWFGPLSQEDLDAFWGESAKGQSVYEDAGGYMLRCYRAMLALPTDEPYTYAQAIADLSAPSPTGGGHG